jgi:hypothetical protein
MARRGRKKKATALSMTLVELRTLYEDLVRQEAKRLPALKAKQQKLSSELAEVTQEIEAIEGPAPAPKRRGRRKGAAGKRRPGRPKKVVAAAARPTEKPRRPGRPKKSAAITPTGKPRGPKGMRKGRNITLRQAAAEVLSKAGKPMGPSEVGRAILDQEIFTKVSKSFGQQVNRTLSVNPEFKKVGRGQYSLKG